MINIKLEHNKNIRDLGGIINKDGFKIKNNQFIRSSHLGDITSNDLLLLKEEYHLKTVIDLRNIGEVEMIPDNLSSDIKYYHIPILSGRKDGISHENKKVNLDKVPNMCELYRGMALSETSKKQIRKVLKIIMNEKNRCTLFHCTVGKDRTGVIALLILYMLDVPMEEIYNDYIYTNEVNSIEALEIKNILIEKTHNEEYAQEVMDTHLAKREYLDSIIECMEEDYGSILGFIIYGLKISKRKIAKFKESALEK